MLTRSFVEITLSLERKNLKRFTHIRIHCKFITNLVNDLVIRKWLSKNNSVLRQKLLPRRSKLTVSSLCLGNTVKQNCKPFFFILVLEADKENVIKEAPQMFKKIVESHGIERGIDAMIKLMDGT